MAQRKATCVKFAKTCLAAALALGAAATPRRGSLLYKTQTKRATRRLAASLAIITALAAALSAQAADNDLGGGTQSITTENSLRDNTWRNGVLNVSASQNFNDATTTLGSGLTVNQTAGMWGISGTGTLKIEGAVVNYSSTSVPYFIKRSNNTTYGGTTQITFDNGTFSTTQTEIKFTGQANSTIANRDVVANLTMKNNSSLAAPSDKDITFGGMEMVKNGNTSYTHKTLNVTVNVTDSAITAKQIVFGQSTSYLATPASSANNITFGSGATVNLYRQLYAYQYPAATIKFNGATVNYLGEGGTISFIGQNANVTTDIYEIQSGGLTIDIPSGKSVTTDSNASALKGSGGVTKTGAGSITWNSITSKSPSGKMTFTGPLVVSNGTWTSTKDYAASAFRADGGRLVLSGVLSAANVALAATEGGTLTLAGANITDASPDMTLAGGGTTDYFTRDNAVGTYTLDSLSLGAGAVLDLDADATTVDAIAASTTNITATSAAKATINLKFSALPSPGQTFTLFETDSADKFTVTPKLGSLTLPSEVSIADGKLVLTITADDYTWNGSGTNWGGAGAWTLGGNPATWADGNNAIFSTANAEATLAANASAAEVRFTADAAVSGSATLIVPSVSVAPSVSATISAPTDGAMTKTGVGTLTLAANRTAQTTLAEGTLVMAPGATVDGAKLTLGADAAKPVTFDYGSQTLTANPTAYLGAGMDVTLTNGTFTYTANCGLNDENTPATLTIAKDAVFTTSSRYLINTASGKTIHVAGGEFDPASPDGSEMNAWIMGNSSGLLRIRATDGAVIKMNGYLFAGTGHDASGLSPKIEWGMVDSSLLISGHGLYLGNRGNLSVMSNNPITPECRLGMTNSVFSVDEAFVLGQNPTENTTQSAGYYIAEFDNCTVTSKLCRVYGDRPRSRIYFNRTTLVSNGNGDNWIDAVGFEDGVTPVTVGADGLVMDNNGNAMTVTANLGGTGALTFTGSAATTLAAGVAIAPPATVASGSTLSLTGSAQTTIGALTLEAGSTLNIASYTAGVTPLAVTTLTAPADGTATLTYAGGAFSTGTYKILEKSGITAAEVQGKLVPSTGGETYSYSVSGNTLVLTVGSPVHGRWRASAVGGDFSNPDNWEDGVVPVADDTLDFSGVTSSCTINFGDLSGTQFAGVDLGTTARQITINGTLRVASMKVTAHDANFSVAAGSKLVVDGDVTLQAATSGSIIYIVYLNNGEVEVGGVVKSVGATKAYPCYNCSETATISVNGLESNYVSGGDHFKLNAYKKDAPTVNWIVGAAGLGGTANYWIDRGDGNNKRGNGAVLTAAESFAITRNIGARQLITLDTGDGKTITVTGEIHQTPRGDTTNPLTVKGSGTVVCDYAQTQGSDNFNGAVTVADTATLAINPEKCVSTDAIEVASGATLEVAQSGTVTPAGDLSLADGATLKFTFTERRNPPVLDLTGKTVTFGSDTNITVSVNGSVRPAYGSDGKYFLTSGGGFPASDVTVVKAGDCAGWVNSVGVDESTGNLYASVIPKGLVIVFQ